jgi:hypothetical protein
LARELPDGRLQLIDGHLRAATMPDEEVPVIILDLNEEEADDCCSLSTRWQPWRWRTASV